MKWDDIDWVGRQQEPAAVCARARASLRASRGRPGISAAVCEIPSRVRRLARYFCTESRNALMTARLVVHSGIRETLEAAFSPQSSMLREGGPLIN